MGTRPPNRVLGFGRAPSAAGRVPGFGGAQGSGDDVAPGIRMLRRLPPALIPVVLMAGAIAVLIVALNAGRGAGAGIPPDLFATHPPAGATIGLDAPVPAGRVYLLERLRAPDPVATVRAALRRDGWTAGGRRGAGCGCPDVASTWRSSPATPAPGCPVAQPSPPSRPSYAASRRGRWRCWSSGAPTGDSHARGCLHLRDRPALGVIPAR